MSEQPTAPDASVLDDLFETVLARRDDDPSASYTASLYARGMGEIARKLGEEATETLVAALDGGAPEVTSESADLLYHLLVLWAEKGVRPGDVWAELRRRQGTSGIAEKRARPKT